jgi:hypothetical protein
MRVALLLIALLASEPLSLQASPVSRVYVSMYPCSPDVRNKVADHPGAPTVTVYDSRKTGDQGYHGFAPRIAITKSGPSESEFYFDLEPGNYEAVVASPHSRRFPLIHDGPLIVISGHDRHLFIAGCSLTDWHSAAAVAGAMPQSDVAISVLVSEHQMHCADEIDALDQKTLKPLISYQRSPAVIDDGAYYANFYGYGKQNNTVALEFTGALFTRGVLLLTNTPDTAPNKPTLIIKNITPSIVQAATRASGTIVCVPGF